MQKQISSWRKELSIIDEAGKGSIRGKLNRKIFQKYRVTIAREDAQLTETLKQKVQTKAQKLEGIKKGKPSSQNKMLKHLTPNGHYSGRTESPLNSRRATKMAAGGVSKFGGILFTLVGLTDVVCLCIWTLEGLVFIQETKCTPSTS
jgi:hypothetical protein